MTTPKRTRKAPLRISRIVPDIADIHTMLGVGGPPLVNKISHKVTGTHECVILCKDIAEARELARLLLAQVHPNAVAAPGLITIRKTRRRHERSHA